MVLRNLLSMEQRERKLQLYGAFIDLPKAFDSVSHNSMPQCLPRVSVPPPLVEYIVAHHNGATTEVEGVLLPIIGELGKMAL